ncbi:EAL domain-containing protein [Halomonas sp. I1]|uniref:bifunctional diguanylate cyclase/phosphodiesterase n=1 Tax=Halomonas sp. I1 TaxID=393536 RepID=UPI0028E0994D|nr:EAL domain-containing protein [Halomonas sp. I1]MDT8893615.1 EAL domain-containing protein [Halomonas sp. I1]
MSLVKQLWLIILGLLVLAFGGSLFISVTSSHDYIEREIRLKNADNANALALTMTQMPKDDVTLELLVSAQFDTGHYRLIELRAPSGEIIERRQAEDGIEGVPGWFVNMIDFDVPPGQAGIQDGWQQFATLTLEGQHGFAYRSLWRGTLALAGWFLLAGLVSLALAWWLVRGIRRPLQAVIDQAQDIGQRRFTTADEPRTRELRDVVQAMNRLSTVVGEQLGKEGRRLDALRQRLQHDAVTGALERTTFLERLGTHLQSQDYRAGGILAMVRVAHLAELNERLGHPETDQRLAGLVRTLERLADDHPDGLVGRLNGSDFALLLPGVGDIDDIHHDLHRHLAVWTQDAPLPLSLPGALALYGPEDRQSSLLSALDGALADAETQGQQRLNIVAETRGQLFTGHAAWRDALQVAMREGVRLASFPVLDEQGRLLHMERPSRLHLDGQWRNAGIFMPWITRLGLETELDLSVVEAALAQIDEHGDPVGINLSAASIRDARFVLDLQERLQAHPGAASGLWLEVPEALAVRELAGLRSLCRELRPLGCRIGLEHVGANVTRIADLHDLGLDYLKFEEGLISDIENSHERRGILRGMATLCHSVGMLAIAEGVMDPAQVPTLFELGLDGVTGPGVRSATPSDAPDQ